METLDLVRRRASRHVTPEHRHDSFLALYGECEFAPAIYGGDAFRCDDEHHGDSGVDGLADLIPEALAAEQPFDVKPESQFVGRETRLQLPDECQFLTGVGHEHVGRRPLVGRRFHGVTDHGTNICIADHWHVGPR